MNRAWHSAIPIISLSLAALAAAAFLFDLPQPARAACTLAFALFAPGLLVARLARFGSVALDLSVAVAVSLAIDGLAASAVIYLWGWSADVALALVLAIVVLLAWAQTILEKSPSARIPVREDQLT